MACEFSFGDSRDEGLSVHSDLFRFFKCAVEYGRNPKFRYREQPEEVPYAFLKYEHMKMLRDAFVQVEMAAKRNVKSRNGKLVFSDVEEMERYLRDEFIVGGFFDELNTAIDSIPKNCQAHMLRGLARYMRLLDGGKDCSIDEQYMFDYADYLVNMLCWICRSAHRVFRTFDLWVHMYWNNPSAVRDEFKNLPDYDLTERASLAKSCYSRHTV